MIKNALAWNDIKQWLNTTEGKATIGGLLGGGLTLGGTYLISPEMRALPRILWTLAGTAGGVGTAGVIDALSSDESNKPQSLVKSEVQAKPQSGIKKDKVTAFKLKYNYDPTKNSQQDIDLDKLRKGRYSKSNLSVNNTLDYSHGLSYFNPLLTIGGSALLASLLFPKWRGALRKVKINKDITKNLWGKIRDKAKDAWKILDLILVPKVSKPRTTRATPRIIKATPRTI